MTDYNTHQKARVEYATRAKFRQYPPQKRMVLFGIRESRNDKLVWESVQFPWLTFGGILNVHLFDEGPPTENNALPYVFCHPRPWKDLDDALNGNGGLALVRHLPYGFHNDAGRVCMGSATRRLITKQISVEEAFWGTANIVSPQCIRDLQQNLPLLGDCVNLRVMDQPHMFKYEPLGKIP